jgi:thymidine kinase
MIDAGGSSRFVEWFSGHWLVPLGEGGGCVPEEITAAERRLGLQLPARVVDDLDLDVFAFGITTDFRSKLFPGSQRLVELADRVEVLQVEALCWCGARATHNARTVGGVMVVEGAQVVVGDVNQSPDEIGYEVLCRRHHRRRMTAATARAAALSPDVLPVEVADVSDRPSVRS